MELGGLGRYLQLQACVLPCSRDWLWCGASSNSVRVREDVLPPVAVFALPDLLTSAVAHLHLSLGLTLTPTTI